MKPLLLFLMLSFISLDMSAQNDKQLIDFVRAIFHKKNISYTDSLSHETIDELTSYIDGQPGKKPYWDKALKITKTEKEYIKKQLTLSKEFTWKPGLLNSARFLTSDTIKRMRNLERSDTLGRTYLVLNYDPIYGFSKPIFLRNHSLCFFYQDRACGPMCGGGNFSIYIKRKHRWVLWGTIYVWIS